MGDNRVKFPNTPAVATETSWVEWFTDDFYPRYTRQVWVASAALVGAAILYFAWSTHNESSAVQANRELGAAYVFLSQDRFSESEQALTAFLREGHSGLARDKAYLFLGKVYYGQGKYDQALETYGKVGKGGKTPLISSGALHGVAACYMEKKEYARAAETLDEFLSVAMRRTGNPKEELAGEEIVDWSPSVPNALWKQALCYRELKQPEKAKAAVEKLRKAYPDSREARDGEKLIALME